MALAPRLRQRLLGMVATAMSDLLIRIMIIALLAIAGALILYRAAFLL